MTHEVNIAQIAYTL